MRRAEHLSVCLRRSLMSMESGRGWVEGDEHGSVESPFGGVEKLRLEAAGTSGPRMCGIGLEDGE